jgi:SNF2 family DNA or RNA helicase
MLRRTKEEVWDDLPSIRRVTLPVELTNRRDYEKAHKDFVSWLREHGGIRAVKRAAGAMAVVRLGTLRRIAGEGKRRAAIEWIEDWLEDTDQKLVVFAIHRSVTLELHKHFKRSVCIVGGVSPLKRRQAVHQFTHNKTTRLLFANIQAAGEGLDGLQQACSAALFLELPWLPTELDQAIGRIVRFGQKESKTSIYMMTARNTLEEDLIQILEDKRTIIKQVIDGTDPQVARLVERLVDGNETR